MRVAWFRSQRPVATEPLASMGQLIEAMRARHAIDVIDEAHAHETVWQHAGGAFDLAVYELTHTPAADFVWPYLFRYPGLTLLLSTRLADVRTRALHGQLRARDLLAERRFDREGLWELLRAPLLASKLVAVPHPGVEALLAGQYPEARIRPLVAPMAPSRTAAASSARGAVTVGAVGPEPAMRAVIERAAARARASGARFNLDIGADADGVLARSDVVLALRWPGSGELCTEAMAAMAARRIPVVLESIETADWPSLDPQSWQSRDPFGSASPIGVSIDVRDLEHSLMLTLRRLAADAPLRDRLADAAHRWWSTHFTLDHAVDRMERLLEEARAIDAPRRPPDWPPHLDADGTSHARAVLQAFGLRVDLLER